MVYNKNRKRKETEEREREIGKIIIVIGRIGMRIVKREKKKKKRRKKRRYQAVECQCRCLGEDINPLRKGWSDS